MKSSIKILAAVTWLASCGTCYYIGTEARAPSRDGIIDEDDDGDGKWEYRNYYTRGVLDKVEGDWNGDGKPDIFYFYDPNGSCYKIEEDTDFNGVKDAWLKNKHGIPASELRDLDGDGFPELFTVFEFGHPLYEYLRTADGKIYWLAFLRGGRGRIEYSDKNRDGLFEWITRVNALGLVEGEEPLKQPLKIEDLGDLKARARVK